MRLSEPCACGVDRVQGRERRRLKTRLELRGDRATHAFGPPAAEPARVCAEQAREDVAGGERSDARSTGRDVIW